MKCIQLFFKVSYTNTTIVYIENKAGIICGGLVSTCLELDLNLADGLIVMVIKVWSHPAPLGRYSHEFVRERRWGII